jgi:hypothetical protein
MGGNRRREKSDEWPLSDFKKNTYCCTYLFGRRTFSSLLSTYCTQSRWARDIEHSSMTVFKADIQKIKYIRAKGSDAVDEKGEEEKERFSRSFSVLPP